MLKKIYLSVIAHEHTPVWLSSSIIVHLPDGHLSGTVHPVRYMRLALCRVRACWINSVIVILAVLAGVTADAADLASGPEGYRATLRALQSGDTLQLRAGV
jgi:hypothetical protein